MPPLVLRDDFINYLEHYIGCWYTWGGDDPSGFDCSGLICEGLQAFGKMPRFADYTADQLCKMFPAVEPSNLLPGCLVFWLDSSGRAVHVEAIWHKTRFSLGASGGDSTVRTIADAIRKNAFIKIRPWASRQQGVVVFRDPFHTE